MRRTICGLCFALSLAGPSSTAEAANTWLQIDTPHFTFISSDNEGRTRDIAGQFEQIRSVLGRLWPWARVDTDRPVTVLCVADDDGMKRLVPLDLKPAAALFVASNFEQAPDRYYIALRSDTRGGGNEEINPYYNAYWPYVELAITSSLDVRLPSWFVSGIAHAMLSEVKAQLGKPAEAVDLGRKAVELAPTAFDAHYALARALAADHPAEALRESRQAAAFARDDSQKQAAAALRKYITDAVIAHLPPLPKSSPPPADALRVGGQVQPPIKTKDVRPIYPEVAAAAEVQGVVIIEATIGADGKVAQATVLRSVPLLDAAALDAVRQWEYQPTLVNGVATPLIQTVTVNFALQ